MQKAMIWIEIELLGGTQSAATSTFLASKNGWFELQTKLCTKLYVQMS